MTRRNVCGPAWIDTFLRIRNPERTAREVGLVMRWCPMPTYRRILDVPSGLGRHANALAAKGYSVTGIERNLDLVAEAHLGALPGAVFVAGDMEALDSIEGAEGDFDAIICLWHSFGWFDDKGNDAVLRGFAAKLRPGGRLILDVYHRGFFETHTGRRERTVGRDQVIEIRRLHGNRELVTLDFGEGRGHETFEWRLYLPEELIEAARGAGLHCLSSCARFDEIIPASDAEPTMQFLFERRG
jgi:SAM-dependent methyltransferase